MVYVGYAYALPTADRWVAKELKRAGVYEEILNKTYLNHSILATWNKSHLVEIVRVTVGFCLECTNYADGYGRLMVLIGLLRTEKLTIVRETRSQLGRRYEDLARHAVASNSATPHDLANFPVLLEQTQRDGNTLALTFDGSRRSKVGIT